MVGARGAKRPMKLSARSKFVKRAVAQRYATVAEVRKQIDKAIEDKYDTSPVSTVQTFACYSGDSSPVPDQVASGHLTLDAVPSFTQGVGNGGEIGQYIGNEIKLKKMEFDVTMYPMTNATKYGRNIKIYLISLSSVNAESNFNMEDCFENDYALDSLNSANYPGVFYLTPRNTQNDNFKSVYKVLKTWKFKVPDNINATDGSNWVLTEKLKYDFKGKRVRLDASGNYLNWDCRFVFTTDVGNDGTAVSPAFVGSMATTANTGVNVIYKRKNWYEDA